MMFEEGGEPQVLPNGTLTFRLRPLQVCVSLCVSVCVFVFVCDIYTCIHICIYIYIYICRYICVYIHKYTWHADLGLCPVQAGVSRHSVLLQDAAGRKSIAKFVGIEVQTYNHAPFFTVVNISGGQNSVQSEQEVVFAPMVSPGAPHETDQKLRY